MITFAVFDIASGRIESVGGASSLEGARLQGRRAGQDVVLVAGPVTSQTHYVVNDALAPRPLCPVFDRVQIRADGIEAARLDLGQPFSALVDSVPYEVADGVLEIATAMPATYKVRVCAWPYQDYEVEIVACV